MSLVYIEYISRRPTADMATFYRLVNQGQEGWDDAYAADQLVLNLGRSWRLGPEPEYLAVWYTPGADLERLDDWDHLFRTGAVNHLERPFHQVARIDVAGCYQPLLEPIRTRGAVYYVEYFQAKAEVMAVRLGYRRRAAQHPTLALVLLAQRIGLLAPEPGGIAVWSLPNLAALATVSASLAAVQSSVMVTAAGVYHDFGQEIL